MAFQSAPQKTANNANQNAAQLTTAHGATAPALVPFFQAAPLPFAVLKPRPAASAIA